MDGETKVFVTNIIDPVNFWARIGTESQLKKVSDFIDAVNCYGTTVSETLSSPVVLSPVVKDQHVIAKSSTGQWLNAIVLSANHHSDVTDEVDVIYVDFGTTEFVPREYLITTLPEMMTNAVGSALHWQLDGIAPLNEIWSPAAIARFSELVMTKTLSAVLVGNEDVSISGRNSYNAVTIFVPDPRVSTTSSSRSVAEILVDEGFARQLSQSSYIPSSPVTPPISLSVIPQFDIERITGVSPESSPPAAVVDFEQEAFMQGVDMSYRCEPYTDLDILNRHVPHNQHDPFDSIRSLVNDATAAHYRPSRLADDRRERSDASQSTRRTKSTKEVSRSSHRGEYYSESTHHGDVHKENTVKANKNLPPRLAKRRENSNGNLLVNSRNRNRPKADISDESSCRPKSNDVPSENAISSTDISNYSGHDERKSYSVDRSIQQVLDDYNRVPLSSLVLRLERCIDDFDHTSHSEYANKTSSFYVGLDCILQHAVINSDFRNSAREILFHFHTRRNFADYMNQVTMKLFSQHVKVRNSERQERLCQNCCELAAVVYIVACAWDDCNELCSTIRAQVNKWAIFDRKGQNASTVGVLFLYSKCLKYFVSVCAKHSIDFLVEHFTDILDEATEKLMSASMPRSIKENMFQMLTDVEFEKRLQQEIYARTRTDAETQTMLDSVTLNEPTRKDAFCQTALDTSQSLSFSSYATLFPILKPPKPPNFEADFPPLIATATDPDHERTEPSVVKIPRKFRFPRRSSSGSSRTSVELSPELCALNDLVAETDICEKSVKERPSSANDIYINGACHGDGHWRQVPRKADKNPTDAVDETVKAHGYGGPLVGKLTSSSLSTAMVLGDFLQECADGGLNDTVSKPDDDDVDFTPMLVCTICGDRTHTIRTCDRGSGQLFYGDEDYYS